MPAYAGGVTVEGGKLDAVILEMRSYAFPWAKAVPAAPYMPRGSGRFAVHKPKLVEWHECDDFDMDAAFEAFFRGVDSHEPGPRSGTRPWTRASKADPGAAPAGLESRPRPVSGVIRPYQTTDVGVGYSSGPVAR